MVAPEALDDHDLRASSREDGALRRGGPGRAAADLRVADDLHRGPQHEPCDGQEEQGGDHDPDEEALLTRRH